MVKDGLLIDIWPLAAEPRVIEATQTQALIGLLLDPHRRLPVLAVSEDQQGQTLVDESRLALLSSGAAHVVRLRTSASWMLTGQIGERLSVYRGAVRYYGPGFALDTEERKHRLWLDVGISAAHARGRDGFVDACLRHVFIADNATFESEAMVGPAVLRRRQQEAQEKANEARLEQKTKGLGDIDAIAPSSADELLPLPAESDARKGELGDALRSLAQQNEVLRRLQANLQEQEKLVEQERKDARNAREIADALSNTIAGLKKELEEAVFWRETAESEHANIVRSQQLGLGDASSETCEDLVPMWKAFKNFFNSLQVTANSYRKMQDVRGSELAEQERLQEQISEIEAERNELSGKVSWLEQQRGASRLQMHVEEPWFRNNIRSIFKRPSLLLALKTVGQCFPERLVILDSALSSAEDSQFRDAGKALDLLWTLSTDYWREIQDGGDAKARAVFGHTTYAARDKENLSESGRRCRTFEYEGRVLFMEKHLRYGTADNAVETLRIHFEWLDEERKIVIGYCGRHLDF